MSSPNAIALTVQQTARPSGFPAPDHFRFAESPVPEPLPGTALVENLYWSVDPYHREMMDGDFELNAPLEGRTLGRVIESRDPALPEGRSSSTARAGAPTPSYARRRPDASRTTTAYRCPRI